MEDRKHEQPQENSLPMEDLSAREMANRLVPVVCSLPIEQDEDLLQAWTAMLALTQDGGPAVMRELSTTMRALVSAARRMLPCVEAFQRACFVLAELLTTEGPQAELSRVDARREGCMLALEALRATKLPNKGESPRNVDKDTEAVVEACCYLLASVIADCKPCGEAFVAAGGIEFVMRAMAVFGELSQGEAEGGPYEDLLQSATCVIVSLSGQSESNKHAIARAAQTL